MEKKEFLLSLGEKNGLKIDPERAEKMAQSGGPLDMVQFIRTLLFRIDVSGYRPEDAPDFGWKEVKP
ncbi:MAG: hypothetical protein AB1585_04850 [Thermodesulfobacteriota bacterium]